MEDVEKLEPSFIADRIVVWCTHFKKQCSSKVKHLLRTAASLLNTYPREIRAYVRVKTCTQMFTAVLFIVVKKKKQPSTDERLNKMCYIHTIEYYLAITRNELLIHAST